MLPFQGVRTRQPSFQWSGSKASLNLMCKRSEQEECALPNASFPQTLCCVASDMMVCLCIYTGQPHYNSGTGGKGVGGGGGGGEG